MKPVPYSAAGFMEAIRWARRWFPLGGRGARLEWMPGFGVIVNASDDLLDEPHPWQITCSTEPNAVGDAEWRACVHPGFVNGREVCIAMTDAAGVATQSALTDDPRPYFPLPGRGWRNPIASAGLDADSNGNLILLPGEGYPKWFESIGVAPPVPRSSDAINADAFSADFDPARTRQIRAVDIVLRVPRIAIAQQVTVGTLDGAQAVTIDSVFLNDAVRNAAAQFSLVALSKWTPEPMPTAAERFYGTAAEPQFDETRLATIWIVSPPDADALAEPDATWTPYVQYTARGFWNLNWASRNVAPATPPAPITLKTGLLGGAADSIFAALLSPVNESYDAIQAMLRAGDYSGAFWT